jgi:alpha-galactosidase
VLGPVLECAGRRYQSGSQEMTFIEGETDADRDLLHLRYRCANGLAVCHTLCPSRGKAVLRTWTRVSNPTDEVIGGLTRFDALSMALGTSAAQPRVAYLLGWLWGPRVEAPGRHTLPYAYPSWIPRLLYGDDAPAPPPPPEGGWVSSILRLVQERLVRLPLRSGKRSTYDNYPWATLLDPERGAGIFLALQWSGTWRIDLEHDGQENTVTLSGSSDGSMHSLSPGEELVSPEAFVGLYAGDWDDGFNACRRYVRDEILPSAAPDYPAVRYNIGCPRLPQFTPDYLKAEIDAAADLGVESFMIDAMWWENSADDGEFSIGLGDFAPSGKKFPDGLRAVSDYVHSKGMTFGLWFEFERVDLRTANLGRNPWSPDWLLYQKGYAYRSWCQYVYLICLGVREAADWALENLSWAIEEYAVDWLKIDSNEWAVCDDPKHDHGATDGEWAQVHGMYHVLRGLRERFPDLIIENCAGGSQRADLGIARFCKPIQVHDRNHPSVLERRYAHGTSCVYPSYCPLLAFHGDVSELSVERFQWRLFSRMMGAVNLGIELATLSPEHRSALRRAVSTYKRLRPTLRGDRYVIAGPEVVIEPAVKEADNWEVYEYLAPRRDVVSVFLFRCATPRATYRVQLKGLDAEARYRVEAHSGRPYGTWTGARLMDEGLDCSLPEPRTADVLLLNREPSKKETG